MYVGVERTAGDNYEKPEKEDRKDAEFLLKWHADSDDLGDGKADDCFVSCCCEKLYR